MVKIFSLTNLTAKSLLMIWLVGSIEGLTHTEKIQNGLSDLWKLAGKSRTYSSSSSSSLENNCEMNKNNNDYNNQNHCTPDGNGSPSNTNVQSIGSTAGALFPKTSVNQKFLYSRGGHGFHNHSPKGMNLSTENGLNLTIVKILIQIFLTSLNVACWLVPMRMKQFTQNQKLIGLANAFSGGVFLCLAFGHMIPHALHGFSETTCAQLGLPKTAPYLLTLSGYLLIFFVEKVAFDTHGMIEGNPSSSISSETKEKEVDMTITPTSKSSTSNSIASATEVSVPASSGGITSGRSAVILLFALAIHSMFETMALGLSDSAVNAGLLGGSIALHQPAESIALLVAFLKSNLSQTEIVKYLSIFSMIGPFGTLLGILVKEMFSEIWASVFVALAAGTFIYVGCTEVIPEEFDGQDHEDDKEIDSENDAGAGAGKWAKFGSLMTGVILVGIITSLTEGWED